jgi:hypothetical protein
VHEEGNHIVTTNNDAASVPWWGYLTTWQSSPAFEQTTLTYDGATYSAAIAAVPNHYAPPGAHPTSPVWCLADAATGLPGAVLAAQRYIARAFAEAALTEAVAAGASRLSDVIDRVNGIPALMAVLAAAGPHPVMIAGHLMAAPEPHMGRIRFHFAHGTRGAGQHAADAYPVWDASPVPTWRLHYADAERPHPVIMPSWIAAAAEVITATDPDKQTRSR